MQELIPRADKKGRVLGYEVLIANQAVRATIRENNLHLLYTTIETGRKDGMLTKDQCLLDLYQKGVITYDAAVSRARSPDRFVRRPERRE
jgi:twitching motility protein PilT